MSSFNRCSFLINVNCSCLFILCMSPDLKSITSAHRQYRRIMSCGRPVTQNANYLFTAIVRVILFPGRKAFKNHMSSMQHAFNRFDRILLTKTCSTAGDALPRSSLQIKRPWLEWRFICIKSVRHSVAWHCSSYQRDPIGSHLPAAKFWSILLEMLSGTTC